MASSVASLVNHLYRLSLKRSSMACCLSNSCFIVHQSRFFSDVKKGGGGGKDDKDEIPVEEILESESMASAANEAEFKAKQKEVLGQEDPFGVFFEDGKEGLGPQLPPIYKRDTTTGRLTGEVEIELSEQDKKTLSADPIERERMLLESVEKHWEKQGREKDGAPKELNKLGARVRRTNMSLNTLGRTVKAQASAEELDDGSELGRDKTGFTNNLTGQEFRSFAEFMRRKHKVDVEEEDIPVMANQSARTRSAEAAMKGGEDPDETELSLKWLTARAQRQMDDSVDDNVSS